MKLLFDQNLSPKLPVRLADLFPGSAHVQDAGLDTADDVAVWGYALQSPHGGNEGTVDTLPWRHVIVFTKKK